MPSSDSQEPRLPQLSLSNSVMWVSPLLFSLSFLVDVSVAQQVLIFVPQRSTMFEPISPHNLGMLLLDSLDPFLIALTDKFQENSVLPKTYLCLMNLFMRDNSELIYQARRNA